MDKTIYQLNKDYEFFMESEQERAEYEDWLTEQEEEELQRHKDRIAYQIDQAWEERTGR